jgi:hypothetical protein
MAMQRFQPVESVEQARLIGTRLSFALGIAHIGKAPIFP